MAFGSHPKSAVEISSSPAGQRSSLFLRVGSQPCSVMGVHKIKDPCVPTILTLNGGEWSLSRSDRLVLSFITLVTEGVETPTLARI